MKKEMLLLLFCTNICSDFVLNPFPQIIATDGDEGEAEQLALIQADHSAHGLLPGLLHFLEIFDKQAEGEDAEQAPTEVETRTDALAILAVDHETHDEEQEVGDGFVELRRVTWHRLVATIDGVPVVCEDETPICACVLADNFRIHQITHTDKTGCDGRSYGYIVEHVHQGQLGLAHIHPQCEHQTRRTTMRSQSGVACELPFAIDFAQGEYHLQGVTQEIGSYHQICL